MAELYQTDVSDDVLNLEDDLELSNRINRADSDTSSINNEIYASVVWQNGMLAVSYYELGTCQIHLVADTPENDDFATLKQVLQELQPLVIVLSSRHDNRLITCLKKLISNNSPGSREISNEHCKLEFLINSDFDYDVSKRRILSLNLPSVPKHFTEDEKKIYFSALLSLDKINLVRSVGGLVKYLDRSRVGVELDDVETQVSVLGFRVHNIENRIQIDSGFYTALNIFVTEFHPSVFKSGAGSKEGLSLFGILNRCKSTIGSRKLRIWFLRPLKNTAILNERYKAISFFLKTENKETVNTLQTCIKSVKYISKILLRMSKAQASLCDWISIYKTFFYAVSICLLCQNQPQSISIFKEIGSFDIESLAQCTKLISKIIDFPESKNFNRIVVQPNVNDELDDKKRTYNGLTDFLNKVSNEELNSLNLNINQCCVKYLGQIGFLLVIEMPEGKTEADDHSIPGLEFKFCSDNLIYYKTPKLAELDNMLGDALESITDMEIKIIHNLQCRVLEQSQTILDIIDKIADLDCLLALTSCAQEFSYVRASLVKEKVINIRSGRHPLQELCCSPYVPNGTTMGGEHGRIILLTGPNACGKSVYLKQVALIVYMAHIGSFVPAESAVLGPIDHIFTRIKSLESISEGVSTFLQDNMQMSEAIRNATTNSLVIVDEYGKGTETTDGLALLTSVLTFWIDQGLSCPFLLVSTHFHSIIQQKLLPLTKELQFLTLETLIQNDELVFLYQIKDGHTSSSYACNIAAVVGLPAPVIERAKEVSELLNQGKNVPHLKDNHAKEQKKINERIVTEFLKLNLEVDDLNAFLKDVVLPLCDTGNSEGAVKTGQDIPVYNRTISKAITDVAEVNTEPKDIERRISDQLRTSSFNIFPSYGQSSNIIQKDKFSAAPHRHITTIAPQTNVIAAVETLNIAAGGSSELRQKSCQSVPTHQQKFGQEKDSASHSMGDKQIEAWSTKLDFSLFAGHTQQHLTKPLKASPNNSFMQNKDKNVSPLKDRISWETGRVREEKENLMTTPLLNLSRSTEKRKTIDMSFLFKRLDNKQAKMNTVEVGSDHQTKTATAVKREKLPQRSYPPSTCSGTIPADSGDTSDCCEGQSSNNSSSVEE